MSVGKPTEGKLGLVREKRGGIEVGIIAIAYPTSLFPQPFSKPQFPFSLSQAKFELGLNLVSPGLKLCLLLLKPSASNFNLLFHTRVSLLITFGFLQTQVHKLKCRPSIIYAFHEYFHPLIPESICLKNIYISHAMSCLLLTYLKLPARLTISKAKRNENPNSYVT